jgi:hypothetical protein
MEQAQEGRLGQGAQLDDRARDRGRPGRGRWTALGGPWLLFLPLFFLAGGALHFLSDGRPEASGAPPTSTAPDTPIESWSGELEREDGERFRLRLAPLHGEHARQQHDAGVLAQRFGLPPGEPFRLELHGDAARLGAFATTAFSVADARGEVLVPLAALVAPERGDVFDPVGVLLSSRSARVEGTARCVLLWGAPPTLAPELVLDGDAGSALPLVPDAVACATLPRYLSVARVEPAEDDE